MAKAKVSKLLRPTKCKDEDMFQIKYKNLSKDQIKQARAALVEFVAGFSFEKLSEE